MRASCIRNRVWQLQDARGVEGDPRQVVDRRNRPRNRRDDWRVGAHRKAFNLAIPPHDRLVYRELQALSFVVRRVARLSRCDQRLERGNQRAVVAVRADGLTGGGSR